MARALAAPSDDATLWGGYTPPMRIYTRTGDDGTTGLLGKDRVPKHDLRVEAYGSVDEFNATLGMVLTHDTQGGFSPLVERLQVACFQVGAELATVDAAMRERLVRITDDDVTALEREIDRLEAELPPLTRFVLPGGTPLAAALHLARTICRRAERRVTALASVEPVDERIVHWLNRTADLLFVMARVANRRAGLEDRTWDGGAGR